MKKSNILVIAILISGLVIIPLFGGCSSGSVDKLKVVTSTSMLFLMTPAMSMGAAQSTEFSTFSSGHLDHPFNQIIDFIFPVTQSAT